MLDIKVYPLPSIWLEAWNHTIKGMIVVNSGKNRSIPPAINRAAWLTKNGKTVFSKLTWKNSWLTRGEQVSKQVDSNFPVSNIYFSAVFGSFFNEICCTFHLRQVFIRFSFLNFFVRFLTITFDFYWSLALQLSCIRVGLSDGMFLFQLDTGQF